MYAENHPTLTCCQHLPQCTAAEFRAQPTAARLLGLGNSGPSQLVEEARQLSEGSQEEFVFHCIGLLMRTASLAISSNTKVSEYGKLCSVL